MAPLRRLLVPALGLSALIHSARAETSPLSINSEGLGIEVSPYTARERGMGEAGMATITKQGLSIPNPAKTAFQDRTSFTASFDSDVDWLQDNETSNRRPSFVIPSVGLDFQLHSFGTLQLYYRQLYHRNFSFTPLTPGAPDAVQSFDAQGGLYEGTVEYAFAPIPSLALAVGYHFQLGRERFVESAAFTNDPASPDLYNGTDLQGDTVSTRSTGGYPSLSLAYRYRTFSLGLTGALRSTLDETVTRSVTNMLSDEKHTDNKKLPWTMVAGVAYRPVSNQTVAADFSYEPWDDASATINPAFHAGLGYEFQGTGGIYEAYYRKIAYRGGLGYERLYLENVDEYYVTAGTGLPLGKHGNLVDLALKYGHRGSVKNNLWSEDLIKMTVSLTGVGVWGQPVRKRR